MNGKKVLCIGACHVDHQLKLIQPSLNQTSNPVVKSTTMGGVVRNIAENLSHLKMNVSLMSIVGRDLLGDQLLEDNKNIMHTGFTEQTKKYTTGEYFAVINKDGDMEVGFASMTIYDGMDAQWMSNYFDKMIDFQWIVADMNVQKDGLEALVKWVNIHHKKLVLIGVSEPKMKHLPNQLTGIELLIINLGESSSIFNKSQKAEEHAKLWMDKGIKKIVLTQGNKAIIYASNNRIKSQLPIKIAKEKIKNMTGAGDAFSAGVVYGMLAEKSFEQAVLYGKKNAYLNIQEKTSVKDNLTVEMIKE